MLPLTKMREGEDGVVVNNPDNSPAGLRLVEMGLTAGELVRLIRRGEPMLLQVGNTRLGLRNNELEDITVDCLR